MDNQFFEQPILNSPYGYPLRHWELDEQGQPTLEIIDRRRRADFVTTIPRPRRRQGGGEQQEMQFADAAGISTGEQQYDPTSIINELRGRVDQWRKLPDPGQWGVTPETARLLQHWRHHDFQDIQPFFCQVEAVETLIWLTEVAPQLGNRARVFLDYIAGANEQANPVLLRTALKLATGAGKTTVMAMVIAWQTVNAVRHPNSKKFTRGFLVVTPGLTIRDRLNVLQPNDPYSYYAGLDSEWEGEFCRVAEAHPRVKAYVKNHNLGLEVPYRYGSEMRRYIPDYIVLVDDGHGEDELLHLIVEIKGYRGEDAKDKANTMRAYWVPGVNHLGSHGRWAFAEFTDVYAMQHDFKEKVEAEISKMIAGVTATVAA